MSWLDTLFTSGVKTIQDNGAALTQAPSLNFTGSGISSVDYDAANNRITVTATDTGGTVPTGTGYAHITSGAFDGAATGITFTGDTTGSGTGTSIALTTAKVNGTTVPAGGSLTTGQVLRATGASASGWGAVDLANSSAVTGVLGASNGGTGLANAPIIYDLYANRPGSASTGTLFLSKEGPRFVYDGAWKPFIGDVAIGKELPLSSSLTWVNQGSASASDRAGQILMSCPTESGTAFHGLSKTGGSRTQVVCAVMPFSGTWTANTNAHGYNLSGCYLRESGTGKFVTITNSIDCIEPGFDPYIEIGRWSGTGTRDAATPSYGQGVGFSGMIWLRITISGSNVVFEVSSDGNTWTAANGSPFSKAACFTSGPDEAGICFFPCFAAETGFTQNALFRSFDYT